MLSTLIKTTQSNDYELADFNKRSIQENTLVNVDYQQNNYQTLLEQLQNGDERGWILFLAPPGKPSTDFFKQAGVDKSRVLIIDSSKVENNLALLSTLLKSNNYNTIVTWVNELTEQTRLSIEADAESTNTRCFIYCKH